MDEQRYRQAEERLWAEEGVTPTERFVRLPRHGIEVRIQELGEGPPVLLAVPVQAQLSRLWRPGFPASAA